MSVNASSWLYALWIAVICQFAAPDSRRHSRTVSVDFSDPHVIHQIYSTPSVNRSNIFGGLVEMPFKAAQQGGLSSIRPHIF